MSNSMRVFIVVLVIVFIGVLSTVLFVGGRNNVQIAPETNQITLADEINNENSRVSWIQEGELVGDNERRAVRITVTPDERKAEILAGYDQKVIETVTFKNTDKAFASFMLALDKFGFADEKLISDGDERGSCPFGKRYIYELKDGSETKKRLWSNSCSRDEGSFDGNAKRVRALFQAQITDYKKFVSGVRF